MSEAGGLLADVVAPTGYAVRGGPLADDLRRYKSDRADAAEAVAAAGRLRERLAVFLAEQGRSVWKAAGMTAGPRAVAVVPSGQGRPGAHPLVSLVRSCVELPLVRLVVVAPEPHTRGVNPGWVRVTGRVDGGGMQVAGGGVLAAAGGMQVADGGVLVAGDAALVAGGGAGLMADGGMQVADGGVLVAGDAALVAGGGAGLMADGADVLVVDDTWVSGGSAQSTAAALKVAGARRVAVVVLGRHVNPADPKSAAFLASLRTAGDVGAWTGAVLQQVPGCRGAHRRGERRQPR